MMQEEHATQGHFLGQQRVRETLSAQPHRGRVDPHLRSTPLVQFGFWPGFQPQPRTSPDLGQVTGGCFPSHWSGAAFPSPDSPDHPDSWAIVKNPSSRPHPDPLSDISRDGGRRLWFGYCNCPSHDSKEGQGGPQRWCAPNTAPQVALEALAGCGSPGKCPGSGDVGEGWDSEGM